MNHLSLHVPLVTVVFWYMQLIFSSWVICVVQYELIDQSIAQDVQYHMQAYLELKDSLANYRSLQSQTEARSD